MGQLLLRRLPLRGRARMSLENTAVDYALRPSGEDRGGVVFCAGVGFRAALRVALAADTVSITIMEIVDNAVLVAVPVPWTPGSVARYLGLAGVLPRRGVPADHAGEPLDDQSWRGPRRRSCPSPLISSAVSAPRGRSESASASPCAPRRTHRPASRRTPNRRALRCWTMRRPTTLETRSFTTTAARTMSSAQPVHGRVATTAAPSPTCRAATTTPTATRASVRR